MGDLRARALTAAASASDAVCVLLAYAREGDLGRAGSPWMRGDEPVAHLADALIATIEIEDPEAENEDARQLLGALRKFLEK